MCPLIYNCYCACPHTLVHKGLYYIIILHMHIIIGRVAFSGLMIKGRE